MDGETVKVGEGREAIDPNPQQEFLKVTHPKWGETFLKHIRKEGPQVILRTNTRLPWNILLKIESSAGSMCAKQTHTTGCENSHTLRVTKE